MVALWPLSPSTLIRSVICRPGLDPCRADDRRHARLHLDAKALGGDGARRGHPEMGVVAGDLEAVRVPPHRVDRARAAS